MVPSSPTNLAGTVDDWILGVGVNGCTGTRSAPCTVSGYAVNQPLDLSSQNGVIGLRTYATDIAGNAGHGVGFFLRVDRDKPTINLSGTAITPNAVPVNPTLGIYVSDGNNSSLATRNSGVRRVHIYLKNPDNSVTPIADWTNPNTDITSNDFGPLNYTLPTPQRGRYVLFVNAYDDVGHVSPAVQELNVTDYPTSWNLGGADHIINTAAEAQAVVSTMQAAGTDPNATNVYNGVAPSERALVDQQFKAVTGERQLVRWLNTSEYYYSDDGVLCHFASASLVSQAGLDVTTAKVTTTGGKSSWTAGPEITSTSLNDGIGYDNPPDDGTATAARTNWHYKGVGHFDFTSADGDAYAFGYVNWYNGSSLAKVLVRRAYIRDNDQSKIVALHPVGCIWTQLKFGYLTVSTSVPGPSASIAGAKRWGEGCEMPHRQPGPPESDLSQQPGLLEEHAQFDDGHGLHVSDEGCRTHRMRVEQERLFRSVT